MGIEHDLDGTIVALERETDKRPLLVVTSARPSADGVGYDALRARLEAPAPRS